MKINLNNVLLITLILFQTKCFGYIVLPNDVQAVFDLVKELLPSNPIILEAGAYEGTDTEKMALLWPEGTIHSFEPVPQNFDRLNKKVGNYKNVKTYMKALTNYDGTAKFFVSEELSQGPIPSGSGSLMPPKEHTKFDENIIFPYQIDVETIKGDTWALQTGINKINFLWLDMQGSEKNALEGLSSLLPFVDVIYTELLFIEAYDGHPLYLNIRQWLEENGFEMVAADFAETEAIRNKDLKVGEFYYGNGIFVKKELLKKKYKEEL